MYSNQNGFAPLIAIVLIVITLGIGLYLVQQRQIFSPSADEADASICQVTDTETLRSCFAQVQSNEEIKVIEIKKQIECKSKAECEIFLLQRKSPLTIMGDPKQNAGFKRVENYDYPLLYIGDPGANKEVNNITIKDLIFDETTAECNFVEKTIDLCNSPLAIANTNNTVVDHVTILNAKAHGIQVGGAQNITIKNSVVFNSGGNGIWFNSAYFKDCKINFENYEPCAIDESTISKYVTIENNLIADSRVAGIEFYAIADPEKPNSIKGNLLTNNHRDAIYEFCPPPEGNCPGGQLAIARSNNVVIEENIIRNGKITAIDKETGKSFHDLGYLATGIELSDSISNIMIKNNKIHNNSGAAIFADYVGAQYKMVNVGIFWNMVYGNGYNFLGAGTPDLKLAHGFGIDGNIFEEPDFFIGDPFKKAFIFSDPPICKLEEGKKQCETTIQWFASDYNKLRVTLESNPELTFSINPNGPAKAPWISEAGATFVLESLDPIKDDSNLNTSTDNIMTEEATRGAVLTQTYTTAEN